MLSVKKISAMEILDSRGNPTVETTVFISDGTSETASVPSGASIGKYEAVELRDNDENRYNGMGVLKAVRNVNEVIAPRLMGIDPIKQGQIDALLNEIDGTPNKGRLGANSILSVSMAICKAAAKGIKMPLYTYIGSLTNQALPKTIERMPNPTFNIINGGKHGAGNLDIQEFHVIPASIKPYHEGLRLGEEIYQKLKQVLIQRNAIHSVGDEGGYAPNLLTNLDALEVIMEAIKLTKYKFGFDVFLGLDIAASHLFNESYYHIKDKPTTLSAEEFIEFLQELHKNYHLLMLEDPLSEDDWEGWKNITQKMGRETLIVGDDLLATNPTRLQKAIDEQACSAILVKPNQIGTISETLAVIRLAQKADFKISVSHRSGETNDTFIADLAVGVTADYVKFGAPARGERVAKMNRLLEIEKELKLS